MKRIRVLIDVRYKEEIKRVLLEYVCFQQSMSIQEAKIAIEALNCNSASYDELFAILHSNEVLVPKALYFLGTSKQCKGNLEDTTQYDFTACDFDDLYKDCPLFVGDDQFSGTLVQFIALEDGKKVQDEAFEDDIFDGEKVFGRNVWFAVVEK